MKRVAEDVDRNIVLDGVRPGRANEGRGGRSEAWCCCPFEIGGEDNLGRGFSATRCFDSSCSIEAVMGFEGLPCQCGSGFQLYNLNPFHHLLLLRPFLPPDHALRPLPPRPGRLVLQHLWPTLLPMEERPAHLPSPPPILQPR